MLLIIVLFTGLIVNTFGDENFYYDDNSILFDLLNGDYVTGVDEKEHKTEIFQEEEPQLLDGVWKCGNCTNIDKSKLLFAESVDLDTNYEDIGFELQIEYSVNNMSCIVIEAGAIEVRRVSGACAGEDVTLSITQKRHIEVKIY